MIFTKFSEYKEQINVNDISSYNSTEHLVQPPHISSDRVIYSIFIEFQSASSQEFYFNSKEERNKVISELDIIFP